MSVLVKTMTEDDDVVMDDDNDQYLDQDEIDCLTDPFDSTSTPDDFDKDSDLNQTD